MECYTLGGSWGLRGVNSLSKAGGKDGCTCKKGKKEKYRWEKKSTVVKNKKQRTYKENKNKRVKRE